MSERTPCLSVSSVVIFQAEVAHVVTAYARAYSYSRPPTLRRFDFTSARPFFSVSRRSRAAIDGLVGTRCLRRRSAAARSI